MEQSAKVHELRELLAVAKKLREAAAQTSNSGYVGLFLRAALALEDRANGLAYGDGAPPPPEPQPHIPVDMLC